MHTFPAFHVAFPHLPLTPWMTDWLIVTITPYQTPSHFGSVIYSPTFQGSAFQAWKERWLNTIWWVNFSLVWQCTLCKAYNNFSISSSQWFYKSCTSRRHPNRKACFQAKQTVVRVHIGGSRLFVSGFYWNSEYELYVNIQLCKTLTNWIKVFKIIEQSYTIQSSLLIIFYICQYWC